MDRPPASVVDNWVVQIQSASASLRAKVGTDFVGFLATIE